MLLTSDLKSLNQPRWFITVCLIVCILLSFIQSTEADTDVSGLISADTTWSVPGNPYIVTSTVLVNSRVTLTIDPNVRIKFYPTTSLIINEALIVRSAKQQRITIFKQAALHRKTRSKLKGKIV